MRCTVSPRFLGRVVYCRGALLSEGTKTMNYGTLWHLAFPLFFFVVTIFCFFFIGDGLRDALDPKDR